MCDVHCLRCGDLYKIGSDEEQGMCLRCKAGAVACPICKKDLTYTYHMLGKEGVDYHLRCHERNDAHDLLEQIMALQDVDRSLADLMIYTWSLIEQFNKQTRYSAKEVTG